MLSKKDAMQIQEKSRPKAQGHPPWGYPGHLTIEYSGPPARKSGPCFMDCEIGPSAQKKGEYGI
jgi:hypothetical protein